MRRLVPVFALSVFACTGGLLDAQSSHSLASPVLGFLPAAGGATITPIFGIPGAARFGPPLHVPGAAAVYVAPGSGYSLSAIPNTGVVFPSLKTSALQNGLQVIPLSAALPDPDLVAFSPRGASAALYSASTGTLQVFASLTAGPRLSHTFSLANRPSAIAVSDDGEAVFAIISGALVNVSSSTVLYKGTAAALTFLPGTHEICVTDSSTQSVVRITPGGSVTVLSNAIPAPGALVPAYNGVDLLVTSTAHKSLYLIEAGHTHEISVQNIINTVQPLSGGRIFLLTYSDGASGLLADRNGELSTYFIGTLRGATN